MKVIAAHRDGTSLRMVIVAEDSREEEMLHEESARAVQEIGARLVNRPYETREGLGIRVDVTGVFTPYEPGDVDSEAAEVLRNFQQAL